MSSEPISIQTGVGTGSNIFGMDHISTKYVARCEPCHRKELRSVGLIQLYPFGESSMRLAASLSR